jgi:hypothetical protein
MDWSIKFRPTKPRSPHLNGKIERTQRADLEEFWATADPKLVDLQQRLDEWQRFYNSAASRPSRYAIEERRFVDQDAVPRRSRRATSCAVEWRRPCYASIHRMITNPIYGAAYAYGKTSVTVHYVASSAAPGANGNRARNG